MRLRSIIQSIPLSSTNQEDIQIWRGAKNGLFSVRSAYHIHKDYLASKMASSSEGDDRRDIWKNLWKLPVPNAEIFFLWRACHDILPTRKNLNRRKIVDDFFCPICERDIESGFHALWSCPAAMDVWSLGVVKFQKCSFQGPKFLQVVEGVFRKCSQEEIQKFVGVARRIWLRRNEVVHGGCFTHLTMIIQATTRAIADFNTAHGKNDEQVVDALQSTVRWAAPMTGWVKANWDASLDGLNGWNGFGVVIRDGHGAFLAAQCLCRQGLLAPQAAELTGAMLAVKLCKRMGYTRVQFEGDAKVAIDDINDRASTSSRLGHLVEDVRFEADSLAAWQFKFVRRSGNQVAHILSKFATQIGGEHVWRLEPPDCIKVAILLEQFAQAA
jgi:ribonuclease HI